VLWFIFFLSPALAHAGTIFYVDENPQDLRIEEQQEPEPRPLFPHPQLEPEYQIEQDYYFREQNYTQRVVYKKDSSYVDLNLARIDLSIASGHAIKPKYQLQHYNYSTTTTSQAGGSTVTSTEQVYVSESFVPNAYGTATLSFPVHEDSPSNSQPGYQMNAVTRQGHFGYGVEIGYQNIATATLQNAQYTITQTRTSTATQTTASTSGGATTVSSPTTTTTNYTATLNIPDMTIKMVDIPINFNLLIFPIYDGYIQPYLKAGLGMNMSYNTVEYLLPADYDKSDYNPTGTFAPFYLQGWGVAPFIFSYGAGMHIMLTESFAIHVAYLSQSLKSRTLNFQVIAIDQDDDAANQAYGDICFEVSKKATLIELGLAYYF
jgi:hypothetical protein